LQTLLQLEDATSIHSILRGDKLPTHEQTPESSKASEPSHESPTSPRNPLLRISSRFLKSRQRNTSADDTSPDGSRAKDRSGAREKEPDAPERTLHDTSPATPSSVTPSPVTPTAKTKDKALRPPRDEGTLAPCAVESSLAKDVPPKHKKSKSFMFKRIVSTTDMRRSREASAPFPGVRFRPGKLRARPSASLDVVGAVDGDGARCVSDSFPPISNAHSSVEVRRKDRRRERGGKPEGSDEEEQTPPIEGSMSAVCAGQEHENLPDALLPALQQTFSTPTLADHLANAEGAPARVRRRGDSSEAVAGGGAPQRLSKLNTFIRRLHAGEDAPEGSVSAPAARPFPGIKFHDTSASNAATATGAAAADATAEPPPADDGSPFPGVRFHDHTPPPRKHGHAQPGSLDEAKHMLHSISQDPPPPTITSSSSLDVTTVLKETCGPHARVASTFPTTAPLSQPHAPTPAPTKSKKSCKRKPSQSCMTGAALDQVPTTQSQAWTNRTASACLRTSLPCAPITIGMKSAAACLESIGGRMSGVLEDTSSLFRHQQLLESSQMEVPVSPRHEDIATLLPPELIIDPSCVSLTEAIGSGSYGKVYKGFYREKVVAFKQLNEHNEQWLSEVTVMRGLSHTNIINLVGVTQNAHNAVFMALEYAENGSLDKILRTRTALLTWPQQLKWAADVAFGLKYLHSRSPPVLHRDLKSPNLLLDKNLSIKITDFGSSKVLFKEVSANNSMLGTLNWLPPEMLSLEKPYTKQSDVYSFGVVLWEIFTGQSPWEDVSQIEILRALDAGERPPLPAKGCRKFASVVQKCWANDPLQRPHLPEIVDMLEDVRAFMEGFKIDKALSLSNTD